MKQIITHDGQFHADEIFAIALLLETIGEVPILRTRNIKIEDTNNPEVWLLDVGMQYDDVLHNFDHHQDANLFATNVLVLDSLLKSKHINLQLYNKLVQPFETISWIDKNGNDGINGYQVNTLIKSFNLLPNGWDLALNVARAVVQSAIENLKQTEKSLNIFNNGKLIYKSVMYCNEFPVHWKNYNKCDYLLICDTPKVNGIPQLYEQLFKLHTRDSKELPLIPTGKELFFHNNGFLAIYDTEQDAFEACNLLETRDLPLKKNLQID